MRLSSHNLGCYKLTKAEQYKIVFLKGKKGHVRYLMLSNLLLLYLFTWRLLLMLIISNYKLLSFFKLDQMYLLRAGNGEVQYQQNANFLYSTSRFAIAVEPDCGRSLDNCARYCENSTKWNEIQKPAHLKAICFPGVGVYFRNVMWVHWVLW